MEGLEPPVTALEAVGLPLTDTPVRFSLLLCALFVQGVFATSVAEFAAFEFLFVLPREVAMSVIIVPLTVVTL